jgi:hypothetical protein
MSLTSMPVALTEHILNFVTDTKNCTNKSRASLVREVLSTCRVYNGHDRRQCVDHALRRHTEACRQCTISFLNFRFKVSHTTMYFKFNMRIRFPPDGYEWYTQKLCDFCKILNKNILPAVADNSDKDAFSPEEYQSTGPIGEELAYARMSPEHYFDPVSIDKKDVIFSCLTHLTLVKAAYDDLTDMEKNILTEKATRTQDRIKEQFNQETIIRTAAEYLKEKMCENDFVNCSYEINTNTLRMRGFTRTDS